MGEIASKMKITNYYLKLLISIAFLPLMGCTHFYPTYPEPFNYKAYIPGEYTCAHIASEYSQHLNKHGYDSRVIVGDIQYVLEPHAWTEITYEEKAYWIDPTYQWGCFLAAQWADRVAVWRYEQNVSGFEVQTYQRKEAY